MSELPKPKIYQFNTLPDKVKDKVVSFVQLAILNTFQLFEQSKEIAQVLSEENTAVIFYINEAGKKVMHVDQEGAIARFILEKYKVAERLDPTIRAKIIKAMAERNDGDERLIVKG